MFSTIFIAISLSFDSLAASVASGVLLQKDKYINALKIASVFAIFQAGMPVLGYFLGIQLNDIIQAYDHWVAFILLSGISGKILWDYVFVKDEDKKIDPTRNSIIVGMAIATSIDALIVGVMYGLLATAILIPILTIGLFTFLFSFFGVMLSNWLSHKLNNKLELFGALILFAIGLKILIEHTLFS